MSEEQLKNYFLGNLPESVIDEIELRVIGEENFTETLQMAEDDLLEDYLEAKLTVSQRELFEKNYLTTAERRGNLQIFAMMRRDAAGLIGEAGKPCLPGDEKPGFLQKFTDFVKLSSRPIFACAMLIIVGGVIGIWLYRSQSVGEFAALEKKYETINQQNSSGSGDFTQSPALVLIFGNLRSVANGGSNKIAANNLKGNQLFRLVLPPEIRSVSDYSVKILKDRQVIFTQNRIRSVGNQSGQEIVMLLPAEILNKGQYVIELEDTQKNGSPIPYLFSVE